MLRQTLVGMAFAGILVSGCGDAATKKVEKKEEKKASDGKMETKTEVKTETKK